MHRQNELFERIAMASSGLPPATRKDIVAACKELEAAGVTSLALLRRALLDESMSTALTIAACSIAGRAGDRSLAGALLAVFSRSTQPAVIWECAKALTTCHDVVVVDTLIRSVDRPATVAHQPAAAWALGVIRERRSVAALVRALERTDSPDSTRAHAAEALGAIGAGEAAGPLIRALSDLSPDVRYSAAYSLGALRAKGARTRLQEMARLDEGTTDAGLRVAEEAAWALDQIDSPDSPSPDEQTE
jgi:HEAT repeat protein